jgi:hypothetical protein
MASLSEQIDNLDGFMTTGGVGKKQGGYVPMTDMLGPLMFSPFHCTSIVDKEIYASPIIPTIKPKGEYNPVQDQLIEQVLEHFAGTTTLLNTINSNSAISGMCNLSQYDLARDLGVRDTARCKVYNTTLCWFHQT